jgi:AraC-like DNA-binding protein
VADLTGCSRDALKARFRRRDLPSPSRYLRWLRTVAVGYALGEDGATTASVAYRFGYSSGGNLCRSVHGLVGHTTLELRQPVARSRLLLRFAGELLDEEQLAGWRALEELFVRKAA